jgi:transposase
MFARLLSPMRGLTRIETIRAVILLIIGHLNFHAINPHAEQPT